MARANFHGSLKTSQVNEGINLVTSNLNFSEGALGKEYQINCRSYCYFVFGDTSLFTSSVTTPHHSRSTLTYFMRKWISNEFASTVFLTPFSLSKFQDLIFLSSKDLIVGLIQISVGFIVQPQERTDSSNSVFSFSHGIDVLCYARHELVMEWYSLEFSEDVNKFLR